MSSYIVFNHSNICYEDDKIILPSNHKIYSNKSFNEELQELITIARLMGMEVKVSFERKLLSYYFTNDNSVEIKFVIKTNKNNRTILYSYWDNNDNSKEITKDSSIVKTLKKKI